MTEVPIKYKLDVVFKFIAFCTDQPNWMCLKATSGGKKLPRVLDERIIMGFQGGLQINCHLFNRIELWYLVRQLHMLSSLHTLFLLGRWGGNGDGRGRAGAGSAN